jgi:hypothetical protein
MTTTFGIATHSHLTQYAPRSNWSFTMSQIIKLPAPASEYPETIGALDPAESAFLLAVRCWVAARQRDDDPLLRLRVVLNSVGAADAAAAFGRFMTLAAHSTSRRVVTYCSCTQQLGEDEKHLLHVASLVQNGESEVASRVLQATILTTAGAVLALGPLEEIGERFAKSRLLFQRRTMAVAEPASPPNVESWISSLSGTTLH